MIEFKVLDADEVDYSTIHIMKYKELGYYQKKLQKKYKYTGGCVSGQFHHNSQDIFIYSTSDDIHVIAGLITHESLHKSLYNTVGDYASTGLDDYLKWTKRYYDCGINYDGM